MTHANNMTIKRSRPHLPAAVAVIAILAGTVLPAGIHAQAKDSAARARALAGAHALGTAMLDLDVATFVRMTLPRLVEMIGGDSAYARTIRNIMDQARRDGNEVSNFRAAPATQLIRQGTEVYAIIPTTLTIVSVNGERFRIESYMIGISFDGDQTWFYINGSEAISNNPKLLKPLLPRMPRKLRLPPHRIVED